MSFFLGFFKVILLNIACVLLCSSIRLYTATFDQVFVISSSQDHANISEFRVKKYNRTTYVIDWEFESYIELDETIFVQGEIFVSRMNNNQYTKTPFRIPKMNFCEFLKGPYANHLMQNLKNVSNLPQFERNEPRCPLKRV